MQTEETGARTYWFVGAIHGGTDDQTARFLREGIWENGYRDKYLDTVKSVQAGDRIAIKTSYTRKRNLPFDNRGQSVSVMAIKAIGTVKENLGDGRTLKVDWESFDSPREWYFYTYRSTVWRVLPDHWLAEALIEFAFEGKSQDIDRFRNHPYWRERFGDSTIDRHRFRWTLFYEAMADKLLTFRERREELISGIHAISSKVEGFSTLQDRFADGTSGPLKDICPFTVMGLFNRGISDAKRKAIAGELANLLGVSESAPDSFEGIPTLHNQKSWFFGFEDERRPDDIDALWELFAQALALVESNETEIQSAFVSAYDNAVQRYGVGWNLTMGLYWIRPWNFPTLDSQSQSYITKKLNIRMGRNGPKGRCNASDYLAVLDTLTDHFQEEMYPIHSFPELSLAAQQFQRLDSTRDHWQDVLTSKIKQFCQENKSPEFTLKGFQSEFLTELKEKYPNNGSIEATIRREFQMLRDKKLLEFVSSGVYRWLGDVNVSEKDTRPTIFLDTYSIENILEDGCFIASEKLEKILERLLTKKNLILQGPPGTGKTWLAKRLAFALIGQRDDSKIRAVQFHPNLSYEDFIRGWRPAGDGKLALVDGPFMEMISAANQDSKSRYVIVIEEINRGTPAQVFGEMLTLLEADKRTPNEALELSYRRSDGERVFIPDNLYVIGTMNIADRSLALVDLALRRRFAFIDLEPTLGKPWRDWVQSRCGIASEILMEIEERLITLNEEIAADAHLGPQFQIGHSYVTPPFTVPIGDAREWFRQVVITEIGPLLDEYWFDALEKSRNARERLMEGL